MADRRTRTPEAGAVRLQKILASAGIASRRTAETLIAEGRVTVNGQVVTALGTKADPLRDQIRVDGRRVHAAEPLRYVLLSKPRGYVTTRRDPFGRKTVLDLVKAVAERVNPVGRLDVDSEGLLILTNDGELAARLTHPRHAIAKVYHARVRGVPSPDTLDRLARGIVLDGRRTAPAEVRLLTSAARGGRDEALVEFTLHEGRNRQVRRMCEAVGHPVQRLTRVRIGPIADAQIKPGFWRDLTPREVRRLQQACGLGVDDLGRARTIHPR